MLTSQFTSTNRFPRRQGVILPRVSLKRTGRVTDPGSSFRRAALQMPYADGAGSSNDQTYNVAQVDQIVKLGTVAWFSEENVQAVLKMARVHNLIPSTLLVLVGAWAGAGHDPSVLLSARVWLMAALSSGVSAASMVVNDYFDYVNGTDVLNAPDKPLPAGHILPDIAVLFGTLVYMTVLAMACIMEPAPLRVLIAGSAAATMAYTPLLKKWTIVKNAVVAGVIASALIAGGLAAGVAGAALKPLCSPALFAFCAIIYREILMDMTDREGDRAAGVYTLPVVAGQPAALAGAVGAALLGTAVAIWILVSSPAAVAAIGGSAESMRMVVGGDVAAGLPLLRLVVGVVCAVRCCAQLVGLAWGIQRSGFGDEDLSAAVDGCMAPIGLGVLVLAAVAV